MHKSALIGVFLAILELVRHKQVQTEQNQLFGEIWVVPGPEPTAELDPSAIDTYEHGGSGQ
jgi:segregation and condensation protein A